MMVLRILSALCITVGLGVFLGVASKAQVLDYRVTVSNLTPAIAFDASSANTPPKGPNFRPKNDFSSQPFTSPIFATHDSSYVMWRNGSTASAALQQIAEDGFNKKPGNFTDPSYMLGSLQQQQAAGHVLNLLEVSNPNFNPTNRFANSGGDVVPGSIPFPLTNWLPSQSSVGFDIFSDVAHHYLSGAFMLIRTNDGFTGLDSIDLNTISPGGGTYDLYAYDAGTEKNTEAHDDLVYFDSPPSGHTAEDVNSGIHLHSGIVGGPGSVLGPYGWNNQLPVARITITLVPEPGILPLLASAILVGGSVLARRARSSRRLGEPSRMIGI